MMPKIYSALAEFVRAAQSIYACLPQAGQNIFYVFYF